MPTKMKTILVDDEINSRETLALLLGQYCSEVEVVGTASNLNEAEALLEALKPSLVFLDIQIGTQTIFELLNRLPSIDFEIIFISAYENYAIKAIRFMAIDYLLKPINIQQLTEAVQRAYARGQQRNSQVQLEALMGNLQQRDGSQHRIALATADSYELVQVDEVLYCLAEGSYTRFILKNGEELFVSRHLKYYEQLLNEYNFYRSHQSCLLNLQHIKRVLRSDGGMVEMTDGKQLPISRNRKTNLINALRIR